MRNKNEENTIIPLSILQLYREKLERRKAALDLPQPDKANTDFGQIWTTKFDYELPDEVTKSVSETRYVVILPSSGFLNNKYPDVKVAPLSFETINATDLDFILNKECNPLDFEAIVEVWNSTYMLAKNLDRYTGRIDEKVLVLLERLWLKSEIAKEEGEKEAAKIDIRRVPTGKPIIDPQDPRLEFQTREREVTGYLREQYSALLSWIEKLPQEHIINETKVEEDDTLSYNASNIVFKVGNSVIANLKEMFFPQLQEPSFAMSLHWSKNELTINKLLLSEKSLSLLEQSTEQDLRAIIRSIGGVRLLEISGFKSESINSIEISILEQISEGKDAKELFKFAFRDEELRRDDEGVFISLNADIMQQMNSQLVNILIRCDRKNYTICLDLR